MASGWPRLISLFSTGAAVTIPDTTAAATIPDITAGIFSTQMMAVGIPATLVRKVSIPTPARVITLVPPATAPGWMTYSGESQINQPSNDRPNENQIALRVNVPDAVCVWIEGQPTRQMGTERVYLSPPLEPGKTYTYTVRAAWMANGREMTEEKKQEGQPGQEVAINFTDRSDRMPATTDSRDRPAVADPNIGLLPPRAQSFRTKEKWYRRATVNSQCRRWMEPISILTLFVDAPITCDGKACKLEDLQQGCHVKVTTGTNQKTAMKIEVRSAEKADEPQPRGLAAPPAIAD